MNAGRSPRLRGRNPLLLIAFAVVLQACSGSSSSGSGSQPNPLSKSNDAMVTPLPIPAGDGRALAGPPHRPVAHPPAGLRAPIAGTAFHMPSFHLQAPHINFHIRH